MPVSVDDGLAARLRRTIRDEGPMRFDRFMQAALYDPASGYYTAHRDRPRAGAAGDFITAPTLSPLFGAALARAVADAWDKRGRPARWWLMEAAGGTGALMAPLLDALADEHPEAHAGIEVVLADLDPAHRAAAEKVLGDRLPPERRHVGDTLVDPAGRPVVLLANELLDNLPVRILRRVGGAWKERRVDVRDDGTFGWSDTDAPQDLVAWADAFDLPVPDDHCIEVPVGAHHWLEETTARLGDAPALMLLIDYGMTALELFTEPRRAGTLTAFAGHEQSMDVLEDPGTHDITHQVDFTAVARKAGTLGWTPVGYTTQSSFLMDLGLMEDAARLGAEVRDERAFARMEALKQVLLPGGMGERFKVLGLSRDGPPAATPLRGFARRRPLDPRPRGP